LVALLVLLVPSTASAAIVTTQTTAAQAAQLLAGPGVTVSNATFAGAGQALGTFSGGAASIGFDQGVILSSGDIALVTGPNDRENATANNGTGGDASLDALVGGGTQDAAVLEFDFVPTKGAISFTYVFGSEEYNEFVNSNFNDVFAFFVNGQNCALLPGTSDAVSINNVNAGKNAAFYRNNSPGPFDTQLDGLTVILNCPAPVTPNQINHLKLAIADRGDSSYDSDVFLQAGSVTTDPPSTKGRMGGKGSLNDTSTATPFAGTATFAYALDCTKAKNPITTRQNPLEVRFGGQRFTLSSVLSIGCSTTGAGTPSAGFDTMTGSASGVLRRANGSTVSATADFRFFDGGAGPNDRSRIVITDSSGQVLVIDGAPAKFPGSSQLTGENIAAP